MPKVSVIWFTTPGTDAWGTAQSPTAVTVKPKSTTLLAIAKRDGYLEKPKSRRILANGWLWRRKVRLSASCFSVKGSRTKWPLRLTTNRSRQWEQVNSPFKSRCGPILPSRWHRGQMTASWSKVWAFIRTFHLPRNYSVRLPAKAENLILTVLLQLVFRKMALLTSSS